MNFPNHAFDIKILATPIKDRNQAGLNVTNS